MLPNDIVKPDYQNACFSQLPALIESLLTDSPAPPLATLALDGLPREYERIVLIFADSFGWSFYERFAERHPLLHRLTREGAVSKITSQFPSTTAAHVTTIGCNQVVGEHGVFEWQYYEPQLDAVIVPLLFTFAGAPMPELLRQTGIDPARLYPTPSWFEALTAKGVRSTIFLPHEYLQSSYNAVMTRGAEVITYKTLAESLVNMRLSLEKTDGPTCHYFYYDGIDAVSHRHGPDAGQTEAEIEAFLSVLQQIYFEQGLSSNGKTLFILAADHGQTAVDPARTIYLNQLPEFDRLRPLLRTDRQGEPLVPGGSPRDPFLYIKEEALDEAQALLSKALNDRADVIKTQELIEQGFFGTEQPSQAFLSRVGNLVILPRAHECVWWYEKDRFEQKHRGHHGGLTADEMETPLILYPI